jgi:phenylalanyl-tRNA synthetase beta chain
MQISREWLQTYFDSPLPPVEVLSDALTFHAFEIESIEGDVLDVKITANRGHDCLSYHGIAKEISAILNIPIAASALEAWNQMQHFSLEMPVGVHIAEPDLCSRYIAWSIKGVKVGPSPKWLVDRLAAMGQQSINNIVDAANYVMFNTGQPLHAFDAGKLKLNDKGYAIEVRKAKEGEKLLALDNKEYFLKDSMLVIVDANAGVPVGIAGIKGGMPAGVNEKTTDIIIESANFNGVSIRKTAQALKLRTDASQRFEQVISPEFAAMGMRSAAKMIFDLAGGELGSFSDAYPKPQEKRTVSVTSAKINRVLGTRFDAAQIEDVFNRLGFTYTKDRDTYTVEVPFERLDIVIPEDLVEEVGRIIGYDKVPAVEMEKPAKSPAINENFASAEKLREELVGRGYSEVFTSVFVEKGERAVANKIDGDKPYLRASLTAGLKDAYDRNLRNKDLLGLSEIKLFEIGTVWKDGKEVTMLGMADNSGVQEEPLVAGDISTYDTLPFTEAKGYKSFSRYPFIVRDVAMWVPAETNADEVLKVITETVGDLVVRSGKFDEFKKDDKTSFAFRLIFQSFEKTLTDVEVNEIMDSVHKILAKKGYEIR